MESCIQEMINYYSMDFVISIRLELIILGKALSNFVST
jgi:hypothetical protein